MSDYGDTRFGPEIAALSLQRTEIVRLRQGPSRGQTQSAKAQTEAGRADFLCGLDEDEYARIVWSPFVDRTTS